MSQVGLLALILAGVLTIIVLVAFPLVRLRIGHWLLGIVILGLGAALAALMFIAITGFDPQPLIRKTAVMLTRHQVVDFYTLFPPQYQVHQVLYENTDDDEEEEWVVFYRFDLVDGRSPYAGAIYDYDRGSPPVLFPYHLVPPDRNYLSESVINLVTTDFVKAGEVESQPELLVYGQEADIFTDLTIFRNIPNSLPWEFPRDEPRRYQVIGVFRGDGGILFDEETKRVTVSNRQGGYDRSQLAVKTVYALDETRGTYMSPTDPQQLSAPVSSQVIFAFGMPPDILDTPFAEKLVVGFYSMLAEKDPSVQPRDFLTGQALIEYDRDNLNYFGFGDATGDVTAVTITLLSYAPEVEQVDPNVTIEGEQPRYLAVSVAFEAKVGGKDVRTSAPITWVATQINGKWKIDRRL